MSTNNNGNGHQNKKPGVLERAQASGRVRIGSSRRHNRQTTDRHVVYDSNWSANGDDKLPPSTENQSETPKPKIQQLRAIIPEHSSKADAEATPLLPQQQQPINSAGPRKQPFTFFSRRGQKSSPSTGTGTIPGQEQHRGHHQPKGKNGEPTSFSASSSIDDKDSKEPLTNNKGSKYEQVNGQVNELKGIMAKTIASILQRGDGVKEMEERADNLQHEGKKMGQMAKTLQKQQSKKHHRWTILFAVCIVVFLAIVILLGVYLFHGFG